MHSQDIASLELLESVDQNTTQEPNNSPSISNLLLENSLLSMEEQLAYLLEKYGNTDENFSKTILAKIKNNQESFCDLKMDIIGSNFKLEVYEAGSDYTSGQYIPYSSYFYFININNDCSDCYKVNFYENIIKPRRYYEPY